MCGLIRFADAEMSTNSARYTEWFIRTGEESRMFDNLFYSVEALLLYTRTCT